MLVNPLLFVVTIDNMHFIITENLDDDSQVVIVATFHSNSVVAIFIAVFLFHNNRVLFLTQDSRYYLFLTYSGILKSVDLLALLFLSSTPLKE